MFGYKREEVARGCINEELHNLYASPYIIRVIRSRRIRWEGHVGTLGRHEKCEQ